MAVAGENRGGPFKQSGPSFFIGSKTGWGGLEGQSPSSGATREARRNTFDQRGAMAQTKGHG